MRRLCYFLVLLLVYLVESRPNVSGGLGQRQSADSLEWNQQQPLENQQPQEYQSPEREEIDNLLDERSPRLLLDDYKNVNIAGYDQQLNGGDLQHLETSALDDREKRSYSDDLRLDADIKRYESILEETGKALERSALTEEERQNEDIESSNREKRSASSDSLEDDAVADESEDNTNARDEGDDNSADETVAEDEESNEEAVDPASLELDELSDTITRESDDANAAGSEDNASDDDSSEEDASEEDASEDDAAEGDAAGDDGADDDSAEDGAAEPNATEDDEAEGDAAEEDAVEDNASVDHAAEDDLANEEDDSENDSLEEVDKNEADLEDSLTEVKSLDNFLEGLNEQTDELSQLRDGLSSVLDAEYTPKDSSRTRRQTVKRLGNENTVDYLKSLPQYKDVPRDVLSNVVQSLTQSGAEVKQPAVVEETHEPQPVERQAIRVPKADMPTMAPVPQAPATPCSSGSSKGPQTKEEKELDKVIDMRKAEEALVAKEQDEVIKAEHMAHTMQEDLHDVMREIRALKVEINAERKDAEKVSIETKEAQKDLELHDERKYNARRKVDELYMRLTDLESDTCDTRNKRKVLERVLDTEHYVLARRRRMLKNKQKEHHAHERAAGNVLVPSNGRQSGGVQLAHKADELGQVVLNQLPVAEAQAVARQAKPCDQPNDSETKKDQEYNNILQQIIIGEAQVKVEDVQVARAEEEAVSLHKRLSNVLSKLAALSIEMKNLQTQAQVSGKRAKEAQAELAYHDQVLFTARKKVNAARNLESDLQRAITDQQMNAKGKCSSTCAPSNSQGR